MFMNNNENESSLKLRKGLIVLIIMIAILVLFLLMSSVGIFDAVGVIIFSLQAVLFGIFFAVVIVSFAWSMLTKVEPDLQIYFAGNPPVDQNIVTKPLQKELEKNLKDATDDEESHLQIVTYNFADGYQITEKGNEAGIGTEVDLTTSTDADKTAFSAVMVSINAGDPALYITDREFVELRMEEGLFASLDTLKNFKYSTMEEIKGKSEQDKGKEHVFAISVEGNTLLEKCGIDTTDKFIAVRVVLSDQKDNESYKIMYDNAITTLRYIVKYNPK